MADSNQRLLAIQFRRFGPYHKARLNSARDVLAGIGWDVVGVETATLDAIYQWEPDQERSAHSIHTVFPGVLADHIPRRSMHLAFQAALSHLNPDALAIAGWVGADAMSCHGWAREHQRVALLMSETRQADSSPMLLKRLIKSWRLRRYQAALVGGQSHAEYLRLLGFSGPIELGYNVVDNTYFSVESSRWRSRVQTLLHPYLLASNRFVSRKNLLSLIKAFHLATRFQRATTSFVPDLCLLGDGPQRTSLVSMCSSLGMEVVEGAPWDDYSLSAPRSELPRVFFPGFCQIDTIPRFYAHALCFIHPALSEPWGLVINEAMACGLPILCSANGGAAEELVVEGVNGFKFDSLDIRSIASAICSLLSLDKPTIQQYGCASVDILEDVCPVSSFGRGLSGLLADLS